MMKKNSSLVMLVIIIALLFPTQGVKAASKDLSMYFIESSHNSYKADATLLRCGDKNVLIDAGAKSSGNMVNMVKSKATKTGNIVYLEAVIISHPHNDHAAGIIDLLNDPQIKIKKIYRDNYSNLRETDYKNNGWWTPLNELIKKNNVPVEVLSNKETSININGTAITLYRPIKVNNPTTTADVNNSSIIVTVNCSSNGLSGLFLGDLESAAIQSIKGNPYYYNICSRPYTVCKMGHHGVRKETVDSEKTFYNKELKCTYLIATSKIENLKQNVFYKDLDLATKNKIAAFNSGDKAIYVGRAKTLSHITK